jgi:hypothetical protein
MSRGRGGSLPSDGKGSGGRFRPHDGTPRSNLFGCQLQRPHFFLNKVGKVVTEPDAVGGVDGVASQVVADIARN